MTDARDDLEPGTGQDLIVFGERLDAARPVPEPTFRGALGRRVAARPGRRLPRERVRALIAGYTVAGLVLLALAALSIGGHGPL